MSNRSSEKFGVGTLLALVLTMRYVTSIPFLQRKLRLSYQAAKEQLESLVLKGIIIPDDIFQDVPIITPKLTFRSETKYGRDLFYPTNDDAHLIICKLLDQKTATHDQLKIIQEHGWLIEWEYKKIKI